MCYILVLIWLVCIINVYLISYTYINSLSHVTLYIENADGSKTPSGWSTRKSDGADKDSPFAFQPGVG